MSFPPNLGITNSFIIDSSCSIFQEFPSLLPQLDHICSPFSKHKMNGYSRIKKSTPNRSKSVDFADLSLTRSSSTTTPNLSKFKSQGTTPVKIATVHNSIPEHEHEHEQDGGVGEVFGAILGRKCSLISAENAVAEQEITTPFQSAAVKRSFSVRRSASLSDGYSRIHHRQAAEDGDQNGIEFSSGGRCNVKKKGKFFRVFRRLFGL